MYIYRHTCFDTYTYIHIYIYILRVAHCSWPVACCLLPIADRLLPIAYCLLLIAYCLLPIVCSLSALSAAARVGLTGSKARRMWPLEPWAAILADASGLETNTVPPHPPTPLSPNNYRGHIYIYIHIHIHTARTICNISYI